MRQSPLHLQLLNYLQYFDWQWARSVQGTQTLLADLRIPFTMLFTGLGVWGAVEHHRRDRPSFWYVMVLFATLSAALTVYLNFDYGYSFVPPVDGADVQEVRERDYFFVVSFSVWGLWEGVGIAAVWRWLAEDVGRGLRWASPVLLLACIPLVMNWSWADRSYDYAARDSAYNLLQSVEPYGVLFTSGDNDTFPLWYLQEVEGVRRDVTVIVTSYLNAPWYVKQLKNLTRPCEEGASPAADPTRIVWQCPYEPGPRVAYTSEPEALPEGVVALTQREPARVPGLPILRMDEETIDRVGGSVIPIEQDRTVSVGGITPVISGGQYLYPWQQYALAIVDTAFTDSRPVYWASSGNQATTLGLRPFLVRQGVAFKLSDRPVPELGDEGIVAMPPGTLIESVAGSWVDVPRTRALVEDAFIHRSGLPAWDHWPDRTTGIPIYYAWAHYVLAQAAFARGDEGDAERHAERGDAWAVLAQ